MSFIQQIRSNVKARRGVWSYSLAPCTLIVGPNESGKSAIRQALELALTGSALGIADQPSAQIALAPDGAAELFAEARMSDDQVASFRVQGGTDRAHRPQRSGPTGVVLTDRVRDLIALRSDRQRRALLQLACGAMPAVAVPDALQEMWRRFWEAARRDAETDADALIAAAEAIRQGLAAARVEARAAVGEAPPDAGSDEEIDAIRQRLDRSRGAREDREKRGRIGGALAEARQTVAALRRQPRVEGAAMAHTRARLLDQARGLVALARQAGATLCPCCGGVVDLPMCEEALGAEAARAQGEADAARQSIADADRLIRLEADIVRAEARLAQPPAAGGIEDEAALEADLARRLAARSSHAAWIARRRSQQEAAGRVDLLAALARIVDRAVSESLRGALAAFCDRVSRGLPPDRFVEIQLWDKHRSVCRIGLVCDGRFRAYPVLSGAQQALLIGSLATACAADVSDSARVIVIDDVWIDRVRIPIVCAALRQAVGEGAGGSGPTQAIVCAAEYEGATPEGWTRVDVNTGGGTG